jgi:hypothetical protein
MVKRLAYGLKIVGATVALGVALAASAVTTPAQASTPRQIGQSMAAQYGWVGQQWTCLDDLWTRESNWNAAAFNPRTGGYGVPQATPASKMASAGPDWRTNAATQIKWGLTYIQGRYGTPCGAWSWLLYNGWY